MLRALFKNRVRTHAQRILKRLFPKGYEGELFLCGGAFKPLLKKGMPIHDLDLWVRNRKEREKLCAALLANGAHLVENFHPYCLKFHLDGQWVEITYHNVKDGTLEDVAHTFDLSLCCIGVRSVNGKVVEVMVNDDCWLAIRRRQIRVLEPYLAMLALQRTPSLLRTLHRMGQQAAELGYQVEAELEHRLWDLYWNLYTEEERRAAMDVYFSTMVAYKGQQDERLVRRASMGYVPFLRSEIDQMPLVLSPQHA